MDQWDSYMGKKWHQLPSLTPLLQNMDKPTNGHNKIHFYLEWSCVTVKKWVQLTTQEETMTTNGEMIVTSLLSKIMTENWEITEWPLFPFKKTITENTKELNIWLAF